MLCVNYVEYAGRVQVDVVDRENSEVGICQIVYLMKRRPPRSTQRRSSAASELYKRQARIPQGRLV